MKRKNILKIFFLILIIIVLSFVIYKFYFNNDVKVEKINNTHKEEESKYSSNIIENVRYVSKDAKGNEYIIDAEEGEIDYNNTNIIFLTNVRALIKLNNSN